MSDERWAEDTVRMGQSGPPKAAQMNSDGARRMPPLPSRRTAMEVAVGLAVLVAQLGARGGGDPSTSAARTEHPASRVAKPPKESAVPSRRREVEQEPTTVFRSQRRHRDIAREGSHSLRGPQPAPPPEAVEAPAETATYPEPATPEPTPAAEPPPPTPPGAEFGM